MQKLLLIKFISIFCIVIVVRGQRQCENDGQESRLASGYFECRNGQYEPVACASDDGTRVPVGTTYTKANYFYIFECRVIVENNNKNSAGILQLVAVACQQNGHVIQAGDTYTLGSFWYTCLRRTENQLLVFQASGCVTPDGERVTGNATYKTKDFAYQCSVTPQGSVYSRPKACIFNGKEYEPDTDIDSESCWYRCERTGVMGMRTQVMGCLENNGTKYAVGERIIFGDFVYLCVRNDQDQSITREPVGCVSRNVEYKFGDRWIDQSDKGDHDDLSNQDQGLKYVMECRGDSTSVYKSRIQCAYENIRLDGGCYRKIDDKKFLQCFKGENSVYGQLVTDAPLDFEERLKKNSVFGMKAC